MYKNDPTKKSAKSTIKSAVYNLGLLIGLL